MSEEKDLMNMIDQMDSKIKKEVSPGDKVAGKVISVGSEFIFVDIGMRSEAMIKKNELEDKEGNVTIEKGDTVEAFVLTAREDEIVLSKKMSKRKADLQAFYDAQESQIPVEGRISGVNKGGFNVKVMGKQAFCPFSQIDNQFINNPSNYLNETYNFVVNRIEKKGRNIVLSRIPIIEESIEEELAELEEKAGTDKIVSGKVTKIAKFGLFVELGAIEGLVHISEVSWNRTDDLNSIFKVGQKIEAVVLKVERKSPLRESRISLSIKKMENNPWDNVEDNFEVGKEYEGTITKLAKFGAFVELTPGIEGLIHNSELTWDRNVHHSSQIVKENQKVMVNVLSINKDERTISCTLKNPDNDPFAGIFDTYPVGSKVTGKVANEQNYGFFIDLDENITGLLPHRNIEPAKKGSFKKGDEIEVNIESIDADNRRISLSYGNVEVPKASNSDRKAYMKDDSGNKGDTAMAEALKKALGQ